MTQRRMPKAILLVATVLVFGAVSFFAGTVVGEQSQMEVSLLVDRAESVDGRIAIDETSAWNGFDIASAICTTRSDLDSFTHTYSITGTGLHLKFSCSEPGKDVL